MPPDQMLAVKVRRAVNGRGDNRTAADGAAFFIYTGGLYPRGTANLTKLLDERAGADADAAAADDDQEGGEDADGTGEDTDTAATSQLQIDAKIAHRDSYGESRKPGTPIF